MNRTTKVAVAFIVAAGLSTMVYALPEKRAMAHLRLHLPSDLTPDAIPFGPNSADPASKSDPPAFGPNCVGCVSTQNLANGAVTTPKIASGAVTLNQTSKTIVATIPANTLSVPVTVFCPSNTIATGGGFAKQPGSGLAVGTFLTISNVHIQGWEVVVSNPTPSPLAATVQVVCAFLGP